MKKQYCSKNHDLCNQCGCSWKDRNCNYKNCPFLDFIPKKKRKKNKMDFFDYQIKAIQTLRKNKNSLDLELARLTLGLVGESGEVAEKVKKYLRDTDMSAKDRKALSKVLSKELGDVLWYIAVLADILSIDLQKIAENNMKKLASRLERDKIVGNGDNR